MYYAWGCNLANTVLFNNKYPVVVIKPSLKQINDMIVFHFMVYEADVD